MGSRHDFIQRANAPYIEKMYGLYQQDPESVPEEWAIFFAGFDLASRSPAAVGAGGAPGTGAFRMVMAYREFGHLIANLDPLGQNLSSHPLLELSGLGLSEDDLDRPVQVSPFRGRFSGTLGDLIDVLRETYCGTIGVEYMEIPDREQREWLQAQMEQDHNHPSFSNEDRLRILRQVMQADAFEQFLHVKYGGQKRFSLEGAASLIPMLDALLEGSAAMGVAQLIIGMPHRGRLNVLANIIGKPLEVLFSEFESSFAPKEVQGHGDVKYHLGYSRQYLARNGEQVHLNMMFNPSHLEFVNPVVLGSVRARQQILGDVSGDRGVPVLVHGDAAFAGEGVVAETLTLGELPPYDTGGAIHIIINNQIGFTTSPADSRASRYATDIARVVGAPVFHVNGDDPEACVHVVQLAMAYRSKFHRDAFVDLICYRKHGHNELDDPTFTQPVMYRQIAHHVPAAKSYADRLMSDGVVEAEGVEQIASAVHTTLSEAHQTARSNPRGEGGNEVLGGAWKGFEWAAKDWTADTRVERVQLEKVLDGLTKLPEGFTAHRKIAQLGAERRKMVQEDRIDWGLGEALAFGTLLLEGWGVRLSGQDTGRGTFSHRHAVLRDADNGHAFVPLQHLDSTQGRFDVIDTMLSEAAVLGFEYGFSSADPRTLTVWEAQFGDFANVAQVYIDQFMAGAESKWRRMSGITLLLPHGYEGQGPEHSSARLERFMDLCANRNMQVCNLTTPAQLFHALRRQMLRKFRKPLVIMSPKSLLRHKQAVSRVEAFTHGAFQNVIDDPAVKAPHAIRRVLITSGKFYYTLIEARSKRDAKDVAIIRLEQLYPFPKEELAAVLKRYAEALDVRWVQEEPSNMGAWRGVRHRLESVLPEGATLTPVTRPASASSATGYYLKHLEQEKVLIRKAFGNGARAVPAPAKRDREVIK